MLNTIWRWLRRGKAALPLCPEPVLPAVPPEESGAEQARRCLLAGQWRQAAEAYASAGSLAQPDLYDAGFVLAQLGDFAGCLRHWQKIDPACPDLLAQKRTVSALLIQELNSRLDSGPLGQEAEARRLLEEFALDSLPGGAALLARCRRLRLAGLWQEGRLREVMTAVEPADLACPAALEVTAKAACQVMMAGAVSAAEVRHFIGCWLSLLFHPAAGPPPGPQRQALLDFGAGLARRGAAEHPELLRSWEEDLALLQRVSGLAAVQRRAVPVYVPALALRAGLADQIFAAITAEAAADAELLAAGAAYSPAAAALLLIQEDDPDGALAELARIEEAGADPFLACGLAQVRAACGLRRWQQGRWQEAEELLADLGPRSAALERQLLAVLTRQEEEDKERLAARAHILSLLRGADPSDAVDRALAAALRDQAFLLRSCGEAPPQLLIECLEQAAALNPADETVLAALDSIQAELDVAEMEQAIALDSLPQAARIASASRSPQAAAQFFDFARQLVRQAGDAAMLEQLLDCVGRVDPDHGLLEEITQLLAARKKQRRAA